MTMWRSLNTGVVRERVLLGKTPFVVLVTKSLDVALDETRRT